MLEKLITLINALGGTTSTILIGTVIASMVLLFSKNKIDIPDKFIWIIWVCLIFSASMLAAMGIVKSYEYASNKFHEKVQYSYLQQLTSEEKIILKYYIEKQTRYQRIQVSGAVIALEKNNVLYNTYERGTTLNS